ncbi:unnamed protein product [Amoebophrya sp. A25]|nr:unnamed protein product [Amoebophrya sp. A25]|eukprot:GSA25T00023071001.1
MSSTYFLQIRLPSFAVKMIRVAFILRLAPASTTFPLVVGASTAPAGSHYSTAGQELVEPEAISSVGGTLSTTLTISQWSFTTPAGVTLKVRAYNDRLPGPTLRLKRGDTVNVNLVNSLGQCSHPGVENQLRDSCVTNLHTHGLHIGSNRPEDDVLSVKLAPSTSFSYSYSVPPDHQGGTHWYHPHHHGSTALQTGAVAAGALIVDDDPADGLSSLITSMAEKVFVMSILNNDIAALESEAGGNWITTSPSQPLLLVNGMTRPRLTLVAGKWTRLRTILAAVIHYVVLNIPSDCEAMLLAKDGVWLMGGPRPVSQILWAPGNRNDFAVRCNTVGGPYLKSLSLSV